MYRHQTSHGHGTARQELRRLQGTRKKEEEEADEDERGRDAAHARKRRRRTKCDVGNSPPAFFFSSKPNFRRSEGCERSLCVFRFTAFRKADMMDACRVSPSSMCGVAWRRGGGDSCGTTDRATRRMGRREGEGLQKKDGQVGGGPRGAAGGGRSDHEREKSGETRNLLLVLYEYFTAFFFVCLFCFESPRTSHTPI